MDSFRLKSSIFSTKKIIERIENYRIINIFVLGLNCLYFSILDFFMCARTPSKQQRIMGEIGFQSEAHHDGVEWLATANHPFRGYQVVGMAAHGFVITGACLSASELSHGYGLISGYSPMPLF